MDTLGHPRFAMAGHDTGMWIGYALAADHPNGSTGWPSRDPPAGRIPVTAPVRNAHLNDALWHFAFNRLAAVNDQLVTGREEIYFGWQFASKAAKKLRDYAVRYYIDTLTADPDALHASFAIYRALDATIAQNQERNQRRLTLPILAIGGAHSLGDQVAATMKLAADDVQTLVVPGCAHWVAEETPEEALAALTAFLAPYRDGTAAAHNPGRRGPRTSRSRPGTTRPPGPNPPTSTSAMPRVRPWFKKGTVMSIKTKVLAAAAALTIAGGLSTAATLPASASTTQCGSACVQIFSKMFGPGFVESVFRGSRWPASRRSCTAPATPTRRETSSTPSATRCTCLTSTRRGWCPRR